MLLCNYKMFNPGLKMPQAVDTQGIAPTVYSGTSSCPQPALPHVLGRAPAAWWQAWGVPT